jgi:hypothetical protein
MQVTVLVKCPHDVRGEQQTVDATPNVAGAFVTRPEAVAFECDICKGYAEGFNAAKNSSVGTIRNAGTVLVKDNPQA